MYLPSPIKSYQMSKIDLELRLLEIEDDIAEEVKRRKEELNGLVDSLIGSTYK